MGVISGGGASESAASQAAAHLEPALIARAAAASRQLRLYPGLAPLGRPPPPPDSAQPGDGRKSKEVGHMSPAGRAGRHGFQRGPRASRAPPTTGSARA